MVRALFSVVKVRQGIDADDYEIRCVLRNHGAPRRMMDGQLAGTLRRNHSPKTQFTPNLPPRFEGLLKPMKNHNHKTLPGKTMKTLPYLDRPDTALFGPCFRLLGSHDGGHAMMPRTTCIKKWPIGI